MTPEERRADAVEAALEWRDEQREQVSNFGQLADDEEDLSLGYSLLRALAEADHSIVEIADGVWRHSAEGVLWVPRA